jgi:hypothetical protein
MNQSSLPWTEGRHNFVPLWCHTPVYLAKGYLGAPKPLDPRNLFAPFLLLADRGGKQAACRVQSDVERSDPAGKP